MIETASTCIWSWDARMVPSFPDDEATWADAPNWELGHWISGRLGAASGSETFAALMEATALPTIRWSRSARGRRGGHRPHPVGARRHRRDCPGLFRLCGGEPGRDPFGSRLGAPVEREFALDDLVEVGIEERFARRRAQETELPAVVKLGYGEPTSDDLAGAVEARRIPGAVVSSRTSDVRCRW
jgi:hypothetical protein